MFSFLKVKKIGLPFTSWTAPCKNAFYMDVVQKLKFPNNILSLIVSHKGAVRKKSLCISTQVPLNYHPTPTNVSVEWVLSGRWVVVKQDKIGTLLVVTLYQYARKPDKN